MVHLNVRSMYSMLNGLMSVQEIVDLTAEAGFSAVALTDVNVLHGALDFQVACQKKNIKPIFGMEVRVSYEEMIGDMLLLAKNNRGYQALMELSKDISLDPIVAFDKLSKISYDLIVIGFIENSFYEFLLRDKEDQLLQLMKTFKNRLETYYIGVSHMESSYFKDINAKIIQFAALNLVPCVMTSKVYYASPHDEETFRVVRAIDKGTYFDDKTLESKPNRYYLDSQSELLPLYTHLINNTKVIAEMCQVDLFQISTKLPKFDNGQGVDNATYLQQLSYFGLKKRLNNQVPEVYKQRLNDELQIIQDMDFCDYFLIVYDVIRYAKQTGIYVGPGRGSAAGSLVSYCLGITEVDPLKYGLLFERFLNPERISMPDIDIDIPDDRRQEVIDYVRNTYGNDHVAHIITYGTMKAKQAFRDVSRVFQIPLPKVNEAAKLITAVSLEENYEKVPKFRKMIRDNVPLQQVLKFAVQIEGNIRHASQHAAGLVISQLPVGEVVPVQHFSKNELTTQYDMTYLEAIGLIKIDFLGLRNLTIIDSISRIIRQENPDFNIMKIPLDDSKTFELLEHGDTVGIFQLESEGMKSLLVRMKPYRFLDVVDTIALYRPGPMENIPAYLEARANPKSVKSIHQDLIPITEDTFGVLIYQEQIMRVAQDMAGFTLAKADILRKAMSKKNAKELSSLKKDFIEGCHNKGYDLDISKQIYALIEKFANYGFNKSHSVAYGLIAYQMAYLKANYSHIFYTHLLTSVMGSEQKTKQYIDECRKRHVLIAGLNLEKSKDVYTLEGAKIRIPFTIAKGLSQNTARMIAKERDTNGPYTSYYDAVARLNLVGINRTQFESLIRSGSFDYFGYSREGMIASLEEAIRYANIIKIDDGQRKYLNNNLISEPIFVDRPTSPRQQLQMEYETLGFYLTEHPAVRLKHKHRTDSVVNLVQRDAPYRVIAMVESVRKHRTKNDQDMAFIQISDDTGNKDAVLFPRVYSQVQDYLKPGILILLKGHVKDRDSIIIQEMIKFEM